MDYTVKMLGKLAGISTRTIRYYDEIGLLKPARINSSGYRIYGKEQVERLQQIMFYRELGVDLKTVKNIITSTSFDPIEALIKHRQELLERRKQLDQLISNVETTLEHKKRGINMRDQERFEGFKQKLMDENEQKYGKEIREKYGEDVINQSNQKLMNMTKEKYEEYERLGKKVIDVLKEAMQTNDPSGELAWKAADLHKQWLSYTWSSYSKEAHAGLGQMYVEDERFKKYYDQNQPGMASFLKEAIQSYTSVNR